MFHKSPKRTHPARIKIDLIIPLLRLIAEENASGHASPFIPPQLRTTQHDLTQVPKQQNQRQYQIPEENASGTHVNPAAPPRLAEENASSTHQKVIEIHETRGTT